MNFDVEKYRAEYPILKRELYGHPLVYLDNAASTQTPRRVVDEIERMYFTHKANVHRGVHSLSQESTAKMEATRELVRRFVGAASDKEIIFTRGTTEGINLVASSYGSLLREGDEVLLTVMEHHANIVPWQLLRERKGIVIKVVPMREDGSLDMEALRALLSERTKVVSVTHVSNVLGTVNPVAEIIRLAHDAGAIAVIDGAQAIAHIPVNVRELGADFYVFSSHKMYGPTGVGVLYGREELLEKMPPYQGGGEMIGHVTFEHTTFAELPFKFEAGTPDYVGIAALRTAIEYVSGTGLEAIAAHEEELLHYTTSGLMEVPGMRIFGTAPGKSAIISFLIGGAHHYDTGMLLDKLGVAVRTGHHCAQPLMQALGVEGTVRAAFALYNTREDCDRFLQAVNRIAPMLL
ncbi:MAG: cysteine desulfurase [Firmicutes bacterium]|nr:cysteine desulfurase [Bacillota bacterium]MCM1400523.1 cysteine desulfurase [Bacteroides sp.]